MTLFVSKMAWILSGFSMFAKKSSILSVSYGSVNLASRASESVWPDIMRRTVQYRKEHLALRLKDFGPLYMETRLEVGTAQFDFMDFFAPFYDDDLSESHILADLLAQFDDVFDVRDILDDWGPPRIGSRWDHATEMPLELHRVNGVRLRS